MNSTDLEHVGIATLLQCNLVTGVRERERERERESERERGRASRRGRVRES